MRFKLKKRNDGYYDIVDGKGVVENYDPFRTIEEAAAFATLLDVAHDKYDPRLLDKILGVSHDGDH